MKSITLRSLMISTIILFFTSCDCNHSEYKIMHEFAEKYTVAWNSKNPEQMASFYATDGMLIVNKGKPAVGRKQIAETAESYMEAFPDMKLTMDSLTAEKGTYRYYWTFTGTNTGPGGTGNKVHFSGFEEWTINKEGLVQNSIGTYDAKEYNRQLFGTE